jgi:hypothetical protein
MNSYLAVLHSEILDLHRLRLQFVRHYSLHASAECCGVALLASGYLPPETIAALFYPSDT